MSPRQEPRSIPDTLCIIPLISLNNPIKLSISLDTSTRSIVPSTSNSPSTTDHKEQITKIMASKYTEQNADKVKEAHSTLYDAGLEMRNKVAGKEYVDRALANATSDFANPMQEVLFPPR